MNLTIHPLTSDLWPALEDLFGKSGASNGCWCMYWRIGAEYHKRPREKNRNAFRKIVTKGPPPGLLAFDGERAVGWCQLTPRDQLPWLDHTRALKPVDDMPVWSISCFYVRRGYRKQGVMRALIAAALTEAKRANAHTLEAYPVDTARRNREVLQMFSLAQLRRSGVPDSRPLRGACCLARSCAMICRGLHYDLGARKHEAPFHFL
ncbi:MAG TPA: GNAT family N-acetyltransferase [Blastocatellia bacterium]|nr:GNAT family N-acetyltransferase [Blastocatellia bacterium]